MFCTEIKQLIYRFVDVPNYDEFIKMDILNDAEDRLAVNYPECMVQEYWYRMTRDIYQRGDEVLVYMEICCGDDGAIFPDDYAPPNGYENVP